MDRFHKPIFSYQDVRTRWRRAAALSLQVVFPVCSFWFIIVVATPISWYLQIFLLDEQRLARLLNFPYFMETGERLNLATRAV